jgi:hypothetical protein
VRSQTKPDATRMSSNPECARTLEFWLSVMVNCAEPNPLCICLPTAKLSRMALRIRMQRSVWIKTIATSSNNAIRPKTPQVARKRYPPGTVPYQRALPVDVGRERVRVGAAGCPALTCRCCTDARGTRREARGCGWGCGTAGLAASGRGSGRRAASGHGSGSTAACWRVISLSARGTSRARAQESGSGVGVGVGVGVGLS